MLKMPVAIKPFVSYTGTGTSVYGEPVTTMGMVTGKVTRVVNTTGVEVTSMQQVYLDGSVDITVKDLIVFEGKELAIESINTFYWRGLPDLKVVYL